MEPRRRRAGAPAAVVAYVLAIVAGSLLDPPVTFGRGGGTAPSNLPLIFRLPGAGDVLAPNRTRSSSWSGSAASSTSPRAK